MMTAESKHPEGCGGGCDGRGGESLAVVFAILNQKEWWVYDEPVFAGVCNMHWLRQQYADIKGHLKWALLGPLWAAVTWAANRLLHMIPNMPAWAVWAIVLIASFVVFDLVARNRGGKGRAPNTAQTATNALMGASGNFDATLYFQQSYASPLQPEAENNIRTAATQNQPIDREGFYVKLIAIGVISYVYDMAWAYIFRSQLLLLMELNRKILLLAEVRTHYDKAASDTPTVYANYSFGQWMDFLKSHLLLLQHPNGMVEITVRGRDFLKYL